MAYRDRRALVEALEPAARALLAEEARGGVLADDAAWWASVEALRASVTALDEWDAAVAADQAWRIEAVEVAGVKLAVGDWCEVTTKQGRGWRRNAREITWRNCRYIGRVHSWGDNVNYRFERYGSKAASEAGPLMLPKTDSLIETSIVAVEVIEPDPRLIARIETARQARAERDAEYARHRAEIAAASANDA